MTAYAQEQNQGGWQPSSYYWNQGGGYVLPSRQIAPPAQEKKASKTVLYLLAILIFIVGFILIYKGVSVKPPKISSTAMGIRPSESIVVGMICSPCGAAQESSLIAVVGKDNYKGTVKNQLGQQIMVAQATGDQIQALADKDWIKYIDRVE